MRKGTLYLDFEVSNKDYPLKEGENKKNTSRYGVDQFLFCGRRSFSVVYTDDEMGCFKTAYKDFHTFYASGMEVLEERIRKNHTICAYNLEFDAMCLMAMFPNLLKELKLTMRDPSMRIRYRKPDGLVFMPMSKALATFGCKEAKGDFDVSFDSMKDVEYGTDKYNQMMQYCEQDVRSLIELDAAVPEMPAIEEKAFQCTMQMVINGTPICYPYIDRCSRLVNSVCDLINNKYKALGVRMCTKMPKTVKTSDEIFLSSPTKIAKFASQIVGRTVKGVEEIGALVGKGYPDLDEVMQDREFVAGVARGKLETAKNLYEDLSVARKCLTHAGAESGRWTGGGFQFHNMPRFNKGSESVVLDIMRGNMGAAREKLLADPKHLPSLIRPIIQAPKGKKLVYIDLKGIEMRVMAWLCGVGELQKLIEDGKDVYTYYAAKRLGVTEDLVEKSDRTYSKVMILSSQYGAGAKTLMNSANSTYGMNISFDEATAMVNTFRSTFYQVKQAWANLTEGAKAAVQSYANASPADRNNTVVSTALSKDITVYFRVFKYTEEGELKMAIGLPSGRYVILHGVSLSEEVVESAYEEGRTYISQGVSYLKYLGSASAGKKLVKDKLWGGKLFNTIVQAVARDILVDKCYNMYSTGLGADYNIFLTIHDEVLCVVEEDAKEEDIMKQFHYTPAGSWYPDWVAEGDYTESKYYMKG